MSGKSNPQLPIEFDNRTIVKSNDFINGKLDLSTVQHLIILAISAQVKMDDPPETEYPIPASLLMRATKSKNARAIHQQAVKLQKLTIDVRISDVQARRGGYTTVSVLSRVHYPADRSGLIYFSFHSDMKDHFLNIARGGYTKYKLRFVWNFKCRHSFRVYDLLKEFEAQKKHYRLFEYQQFKSLLGIGEKYKRKVKGNFYENYETLKKGVLNPAQEEINNYSDIAFEYEVYSEEKNIRDDSEVRRTKTDYIKFTITSQINNIKSLPEEVKGFDVELLESLKKKYQPSLVDFAVDETLKRKEVKTPEAYVTDGLKKGYFDKKFAKHISDKELKKQQAQLKTEKEKAESLHNAIREEYSIFWKERCLHYFEIHQDQIDNYVEELQKLSGHDPKTRRALDELAAGKPGEATKQKIGNLILQEEGLPEEKDIKVYAFKKYQVEL